jgi:Tol biopolymer transport system component
LSVRFLGESGSSRVRADARQPALSPVGRELAVTVLDQKPERFQLAISKDDAGSEVRLVTRGRGHVAHPVWSPDGTRVAFLSQSVRDPIQYAVRTGRVQLYLTDLRGRLVQLTAGGDLALIRPLWTPRGIYVVTSDSYPARHSRLFRVVPPA